MTDCDSTRPEFASYIAGELEPESRALVERHVSGCPDCARVLEETRGTIDVVAAAPLEHEPPAELEHHVFTLVELEPIALLVADAPIAHEPPMDLERRALQHAGIFEPVGIGRWPRVRTALVPSLAAATMVLGALGFNWRDESADARAKVNAWQGRYGTWGRSMQTFQLANLSDPAASADAELVRSTDNNYTLVLRVDGLEVVWPGYHYEVWLEGEEGRVPAGSFRVETPGVVVRSFSIGVDPGEFPLVQITMESDTGDPAVTGDTIMEAALEPSPLATATPTP
jgi:hypothetical protein